MAKGLAALGVRRVHATPHQFRFGNERAKADVENLKKFWAGTLK